MSKIHLGNATYNKTKKTVLVQIYFHVPNDKTKNKFPGSVTSSSFGLDATEISDLKTGSIVEVVKNKIFPYSLGETEIKNRINSMWNKVATDTQNTTNKEYVFYGTTLGD